MIEFLKKRWFLVSLAILITAGLLIGSNFSTSEVTSATRTISPSFVTAIVLFLMAFSLDGERLSQAFVAPKPVIWASVVNLGLVPLMCWPLALFLRRVDAIPDFAYGLMIAGSVPTTLAASSVWTRKALGNDAVSLLTTILTNGVCFLVTPFWLNLTTPTRVALDARQMIGILAASVLVPIAVGQVLQWHPAAARFARQHRIALGVVAQMFVLSLVLLAACNAGAHLQENGHKASVFGVSRVWILCVIVHLTAMAAASIGAKRLNIRRDDRIAVMFAASQKTLPIGLLLATDPAMFGGMAFAGLPILMYHASQLVIDTAIADRLAARAQL